MRTVEKVKDKLVIAGAKYSWQISIESCLGAARHIIASERFRAPWDYAQCFSLLGQEWMIAQELAERLAAMARFRNRLVHLYWDIDYGQIYDILQKSPGDLEAFMKAVSDWLWILKASGPDRIGVS